MEPPPKAAFWSIRDESGRKLSCFDEGVRVFVWPIVDFTPETIRERWGEGDFVAYFTNREGGAAGRRQFGIGKEAPPARGGAHHAVRGVGEDAAATSTELVHEEDGLERAIRMLAAVDGLASRKASEMVATQSNFLQSAQQSTVQLFQAAMGQKLAEQKMQSAALPAQLEQVLVAFDRKLTEIGERLSDLEGDGPDPDDPDDPHGEGESGGVPLPEQWTSIGDMLYRVAARQLPTLEKVLPGLVDKWLADLQAKAAEAQAARAAANGIGVEAASAVAP